MSNILETKLAETAPITPIPSNANIQQPPASKKIPSSDIIIRRATLLDADEISRLSSEVCLDGPSTKFFYPHRHTYLADYKRGSRQRVISQLLDPRNITFVVVLKSNPDEVIGAILASREGDDEGAQRQINSRSSLLGTIIGWEYAARFSIVNWLWPDRSADPSAMQDFIENYAMPEGELHWKPFPERHNKWAVHLIIVDAKQQGKGLGRKLMSEITSRAREEGVCVGLAASGSGEQLYRSMGFELLGRFQKPLDDSEGDDVGGIMIWWPESMKKP